MKNKLAIECNGNLTITQPKTLFPSTSANTSNPQPDSIPVRLDSPQPSFEIDDVKNFIHSLYKRYKIPPGTQWFINISTVVRDYEEYSKGSKITGKGVSFVKF